MCLNPVGAPVEWCCQFASTLFPGDEDECSPSDTGPVPTPCELGLQSSLAGTSFPVASGNDWPAPFPCWPGPHLTGLSLLAQTSGRPIPAVAVTLLSKGQQVGGWHWLPHSLSGDSPSTVFSSIPVLSWRVLLLRKPLLVTGILHTVSDLPFQHPGSRGRTIRRSRPALAT